MTVGSVLKNKKFGTIISAAPDTPVIELAQTIAERRIGALLILTSDGDLAGIVSERDLAVALAKHGAKMVDLRAEDLMTRDVPTATPQTPVDQALAMMDAGYFRHLPVVSEGKLIGIISIRDLVKFRLMLHEQDVDSLTSYITRTGFVRS